MTEALAIDPFNSNRMFYGTGATLYGTTNLTNWDTGGTITIKPVVNGLEETAVNALISPPVGAPLLSALGDVDGFTPHQHQHGAGGDVHVAEPDQRGQPGLRRTERRPTSCGPVRSTSRPART